VYPLLTSVKGQARLALTFSGKSSSATRDGNRTAGNSESCSNHYYNWAILYTSQVGNYYCRAISPASLDRNRSGNAHRSASGGAGGDAHGQKPLVQLTVTQPTAEQQKEFSSL
jgi:hypothetical protein